MHTSPMAEAVSEFESVPAVAHEEPHVGTVVMKFGGTSVGGPDRLKAVAGRIVSAREAGNRVVAVISAMGDTTDELVALAHTISPTPKPRAMDVLISSGERMACALMEMAIHDLGHEVISLTGSQAGIVTDNVHTKAKIVEVRAKRIHEALDQDRIVLVAGFQGVSTGQEITTLGRGGSDTTAVALAAAIGAEVCEIYTDVSVEFARSYGVKLHVRSSFGDAKGTWIGEEDERMLEKAIISGVTHDTSEAKVTVLGVPDRPGIAARVFRPLADAGVNIDMIVQNISEHGHTSISFTLPKSDLVTAEPILERTAREVGATGFVQDPDIAKVSLIGAGMKSHPGVAADMFEALAEAGINIEIISTSSIRISCVIRAADVERAVRAVHERFQILAEERVGG